MTCREMTWILNDLPADTFIKMLPSDEKYIELDGVHSLTKFVTNLSADVEKVHVLNRGSKKVYILIESEVRYW